MKGKNRDKILSSAKQMFCRYGIRKTNLNEIARLARVAKATIYNYFSNKEQVYLEVLNQEANELIVNISDAISQMNSPVQKLNVFYRMRFNQMKEPSYLLNLSGEYDDVSLVKSAGIRDSLFKKEISILQSILEEGMQEGIFHMESALQTARAFGYALKGMEAAFHLKTNHDDMEKDFEGLFDILCRGILVKKGGAL